MSSSRRAVLLLVVVLGTRTVAAPPEKEYSTVEYDVRELVSKPTLLNLSEAAFRSADPTQRVAALMKRLLTMTEEPAKDVEETIQLKNGNRLVVRTTASRHARFADALQILRRLGDLAVVVSAKLYEVDEGFYTKLMNIKYVPLEELERRAAFDKTPKVDSLFDQLPKQKLLQSGDEVKVDSGHRVLLLSRQELIRCLPSPEQLRWGNQKRQTAFEGPAFSAATGVSADRRYVRLKFTERATTVEVHKETVRLDEKPRDAETMDARESTQTRELVIPDGGSLVMAVAYRPRSAKEAKRWWVMAITARIVIEEEERIIKGK